MVLYIHSLCLGFESRINHRSFFSALPTIQNKRRTNALSSIEIVLLRPSRSEFINIRGDDFGFPAGSVHGDVCVLQVR